MPGFGDSAFLILLALLLFGPKKLPVLARQLGKLMADFRRASNEFRTQMEEELRISEQAERQKQIAALETSAPPTGHIEPESEPVHVPPPAPNFATPAEPADSYGVDSPMQGLDDSPESSPATEPASQPLPIATAGDLNMLPPSTGLPVAASSPRPTSANTTPEAESHQGELETETLHG